MSHASRRPLAIFLTLLSLSLPLAAQPRREQQSARASRDVLAVLWDHLAASFSGLWSSDSAAEPEGTEGTPAPLPETTPPPVTDGRSVLDPLG